MDKLNLFELFAKITLDTSEYEEGVEGAKEKGNGLANTLKSGLATAGKAAAAGLAATSAAAVALGKASLDSYAEYEQLVGGVDTLFKESSEKLRGYAENAYATAGMSANDYMSTVTSFSAALINSVGGDTEEAADMANRALTDMSDNANKMGTSIDSIVATYQSLSRGNFAMLDNLKLGYGGTKAELERLLEDAEAYKASMGEIVDYDASNFADIVSGIGAIQEKMGIAGATAAEAATTIEGSVNSMKAAWANLVTGFGNENADLDMLIGNVIESVVTVAKNVVPRVGIILQGIKDAVVSAAPMVIEAGKNLILDLGGGMIGGIPGMLAKVPAVVQSFADFITENLPTALNKGVEMVNGFVDGIISGIPDMISRIPALIDAFVTFIADNLPTVLLAGADILSNLAGGIIGAIPDLVSRLPKIILSFVETINKNLPKVITAGYDILKKLGDGIFDALPDLVLKLPEIGVTVLEAIGDALMGIYDIGRNIVTGLWEGILSMGSWITEKVTGFFGSLVSGVKETLGIHSPSKVFASIGGYMAEGLGEGWDDEYKRIKKQIEGGLNFGTGTVDFSASGIGATSAGIINSFSTPASGGSNPMTFNLMLPDNTIWARYQLPTLIEVAKANGTPILNPT